jgi:FkbM family methyltransferase
MNRTLRKLIRTFQSELHFLKDAKDAYYYYTRKILGQTHELEWHALRFIPNTLGGCYVDIGANQGQSIESIKLIKPGARVYSFEANQLLARKLQKRYRKRNDITVFPYGLADQEQQRTLFVPTYKNFLYDGDASFDRQMATALFSDESLFLFDPSKLKLLNIPCEVQRLDSQHLDPIFIKIDVQGYEYHVLKGGVETIERHNPILMLEGYHGNLDLLQLVTQLGYEEYVFDETGFYRSTSTTAVNTLLMTPKRAATVQSSRLRARN